MRDDDAYLLDMLVAARKAAAFATELTYQRFARSELHQNAILKVLEVVGEAASRVSNDFKTAHPEIPWRQIVGFRNRIVHVYFEVDLGVVWRVVKDDLPLLISRLEILVPPGTE